MEYTADDIKIISWPEPIRTRPHMYLKTLGSIGCLALIQEILETILNEKYCCNATHLEIRLTRHHEIVIEYNGRGMSIEYSHSEEITHPILYKTFMTLSCCTFSDEDYEQYGHMSQIGPVFNAACKFLHITTIWKQKAYSLSFYKGCISALLSESASPPTVNCLRFTFDPEVMGAFELSSSALKELAESTQQKYPYSNIQFSSKIG